MPKPKPKTSARSLTPKKIRLRINRKNEAIAALQAQRDAVVQAAEEDKAATLMGLEDRQADRRQDVAHANHAINALHGEVAGLQQLLDDASDDSMEAVLKRVPRPPREQTARDRMEAAAAEQAERAMSPVDDDDDDFDDDDDLDDDDLDDDMDDDDDDDDE